MATISSSSQWFNIHIISARLAHIECVAQLSAEEYEILARSIGRAAECRKCSVTQQCAICSLDGKIILSEVRALRAFSREFAEDRADLGDGSINRAYVFAMIESWKKSQPHYSKSR